MTAIRSEGTPGLQPAIFKKTKQQNKQQKPNPNRTEQKQRKEKKTKTNKTQTNKQDHKNSWHLQNKPPHRRNTKETSMHVWK